jgi:3-mercaptopyruvate sulfurtransferase SseA
VYDEGGEGGGPSTSAARVAWALLAHGHPDARVLAGGWPAWRDGRGEEELYEPCPLKASPTGCQGFRIKT